VHAADDPVYATDGHDEDAMLDSVGADKGVADCSQYT
jgi:hypothetical protein